MDKYRSDTGLFALTANELSHDVLADAIKNVAGKSGYVVYSPRD